MKLLTFERKGGPRVGAKHRRRHRRSDRRARRNPSRGEERRPRCSTSSARGIDIDAIGGPAIARATEAASGELEASSSSPNPKFLPPILRPSKILALALNFREHIDETNLKFYDEPIVFTKYTSNMIGHDGEIELPPFPQKVDEEHELALVVGPRLPPHPPARRRPTTFSATRSATTSRRATASASAARWASLTTMPRTSPPSARWARGS